MALPELFTNPSTPGASVPWVLSTLGAAVSTTPAAGTVETWTFASAPPATLTQAGQFRLVVDNEVVLDVTGGGGTSRQIQRGAEGSTVATHANGANLYHILTAGALSAFIQTNANVTPLQNLVPNPSFEYDTTGSAPAAWSTSNIGSWANLASGATATVQGTGAFSGSKCLQVAVAGGAGTEGVVISLGVLPAGTYTASIYLKGNAGGETVGLLGGLNASPTVSGLTLTAAWARYNISFTADGVNACYVSVRSGISTWFVDAVQVALGSSVIAYFDGDSAGAHWSGTPGNSVSQLGDLSGNILSPTLSTLAKSSFGLSGNLTVQTANYTASPGDVVLMAGAHTTTLPGSPANGSRVVIESVASGATAVGNVTVARQGTDTFTDHNYTGLTSLVVPAGGAVELRYQNGVWYALNWNFGYHSKAGRTATLSLAVNSWSKIPFDSIPNTGDDLAGNWTNLTAADGTANKGRFVAPTNGVYQISYTIQIGANNNPQGIAPGIYKNGASISNGPWTTFHGEVTGDWVGGHLSDYISCVAGDYIEAWAYNGGSSNIVNLLFGSTFMAIRRAA